jgi:tetratricopeptide (TPR) repeat protein
MSNEIPVCTILDLQKYSYSVPSLCLNMIVKNESKIITRLLESVLPIIDCYCICDTGSTDNTIDIIKEYFLNKKIPGKIISEPFKDFSHNRNVALKACLGMSDFVLLLDADMILKIKNFNKYNLVNHDSFFLYQGNDSYFYKNMRIVRNNGLYKYNGVTHEYIDVPPTNKSCDITKDILFIDDVGDGGAKTDKFERDIRLLTEDIEKNPTNVRSYFYLANSYFDSGHLEEAISTYKKRIELGGWIQEVWYSYYRIGLSYQRLEKMPDAIYYWLEGYDRLPKRLEGLYEILKYYRIIGKQRLCEIYYNVCKKILDKNLNRDDFLFIYNDVYTDKIYYEYTIIAGYVGITNINDEVIKVLNNSKDQNEIDNLLSNLKFYKFILKPIKNIDLTSNILVNVNDELTTFKSSSCCIIKNPNQEINTYFMNMRYVNYYVDVGGNYLNCDKHIITVNKFIELDENFNILSSKIFNLNYVNRRYIGIEDIRIINDEAKNKLMFIGTGYHQNDKIGIVNGEYTPFTDTSLKSVELTQNFQSTGCEKNWIYTPLKELHVIYGWNPLQIGKINDENELILTETKWMPKIFSKVRGSTCGFKYNKTQVLSTNASDNIVLNFEEDNDVEIWFVVHLVSYETPRHYYHLIVVFDDDMNLLRYTAPLKFSDSCIEYCLGIIVENTKVIITYSTMDRTSNIGIYDKEYIENLLIYDGNC